MTKTIIALALIIALAFTVSIIAGLYGTKTESKIYPLTTKVLRVDYENDIVVCIDCNSNFWEFEGAEDWEAEDCATLLMNDKGTEDIFDDEIISAKYSAWELN